MSGTTPPGSPAILTRLLGPAWFLLLLMFGCHSRKGWRGPSLEPHARTPLAAQEQGKAELGLASVLGSFASSDGQAAGARVLCRPHSAPPHLQGPEHIYCSCVSPCGSWIAYSTASRFHLYRVQHEGDNISIKKVRAGGAHRELGLLVTQCVGQQQQGCSSAV